MKFKCFKGHIKELLKLYTGAYDVIFGRETGYGDAVIVPIPRYYLNKDFEVGDFISISDFNRKTRKRFYNFFSKDIYKIKGVNYYKFPKWQFWRKDKYVDGYWLE